MRLVRIVRGQSSSSILGFVAPASCRLSRGHLALAVGAGRPHDSRRDGGATKILMRCYYDFSDPLLLRLSQCRRNIFKRRKMFVDVGLGVLH